MERISPYLVNGEGVWWHKNNKTKEVEFHDGDGEPESRPEGPFLSSFTNTSLHDEHVRCSKIWEELVTSNTTLPITRIKNFNNVGDYINTSTENAVEFEEVIDTLEMEESERDMNLDEPSYSHENSKSSSPSPLSSQPAKRKIEESSNLLTKPVFKSRTCKVIFDLIGQKQELSLYDSYCTILREKKTKFASKKCQDLEKKLAVPLKEKIEKDKKQFKLWELNFFKDNGRVPDVADVQASKSIAQVSKQIHIAKKLLKNWKIST